VVEADWDSDPEAVAPLERAAAAERPGAAAPAAVEVCGMPGNPVRQRVGPVAAEELEEPEAAQAVDSGLARAVLVAVQVVGLAVAGSEPGEEAPAAAQASAAEKGAVAGPVVVDLAMAAEPVGPEVAALVAGALATEDRVEQAVAVRPGAREPRTSLENG